jgi:hypothetical protein
MSEPTTEIARHDRGDALSQILGTGDTRAMLAQVERNVRDVIDVARDRGFVRRFDGPHEFFGLPAWQLLGMTYGLVPFIEWTRPVDNGWEARSVVKTRDGVEVGAAEAMCTRSERNRRNADDHTLRAMAQTRANRNALRGALGAALVLAGFDFADPDAPATKEQIGVLHQLEREIGWSHEQGHVEAGDVGSFKELTREEASVLIDRWTSLRDQAQGAAPQVETDVHSTGDTGGDRAPGESERPSPQRAPGGEDNARKGEGESAAPTPGVPHHVEPRPDDNDPATDEQWGRAPHDMSRVAAIKLAAKLVKAERIPGPAPKSQAGFTKVQLAAVATAYRDGERG